MWDLISGKASRFIKPLQKALLRACPRAVVASAFGDFSASVISSHLANRPADSHCGPNRKVLGFTFRYSAYSVDPTIIMGARNSNTLDTVRNTGFHGTHGCQVMGRNMILL